MAKVGKKYEAAKKQVEDRDYSLDDAMGLLKKVHYVKFNATVEVHMRLGVDPKHADQMIRTSVSVPHGIGKSKRVVAIVSENLVQAALDAGAIKAGSQNLVEEIEKTNFTDFDVAIATPDMMRFVGKLGKVLGPKGLMPSPKAGTVTTDVAEPLAVTDVGLALTVDCAAVTGPAVNVTVAVGVKVTLSVVSVAV